MRVHDPLYGEFELPPPLDSLATSPEVWRLNSIRLLNAPSHAMATLADLRRFAHTLGVTYLASQLSDLSYVESLALRAAILLHDVGTPPFGHTLEFVLREFNGDWHHEGVIGSLLAFTTSAEGFAYQVLPGARGRCAGLLSELGPVGDVAHRILSKQHRLSPLLFGTLDLDNVDNVFRMAWALGQPTAGAPAELARCLGVDADGRLTCLESNKSAVDAWARARAEVYDRLFFEPSLVGFQFALRRLFREALALGALDESDWAETDESILDRLTRVGPTREMARAVRLGDISLPTAILKVQAETSAQEALQTLEGGRPSGELDFFVTPDRRTRSRRIDLIDPSSGQPWTHGSDSSGLVIAVFDKTARPRSASWAAETVIELLGVDTGAIVRASDQHAHPVPVQRRLI